MSQRVSKIEATLKIAKDIALRSPCISRRRFGSVIVKENLEKSEYNTLRMVKV
jgi:deoxycytidylate deaminase